MMIPMWRGTCESTGEERVPTGRQVGWKDGQGGRVHLGRDTRRLTASRRRGWKATKTIRTVYRKESSACGEAARAMRGNHLGSLSFCGEGGRVHLGRDTRRLTASRRRGWKAAKTIRTVYRKESSACGEAARAMRGNHLGSLSYS